MWTGRTTGGSWYAALRWAAPHIEEGGNSSNSTSTSSGSDEEALREDVGNIRARCAQAAECGVVGVHDAAEVVQSEVGCLRLWRARSHRLLLHKDCICEMIQHHLTDVVLLPLSTLEHFPECRDGEFPVALRIPKDDTKVKAEKEKKVKVLKYPKYSFFRARANWDSALGAILSVEGVHLGLDLAGPDATPMGCEEAEDGVGLPEPLEMLSPCDVKEASGDPEYPEFLQVSLEQRRSPQWKIGNFLLRTLVELVVVYMFMSFLGTQPNTYTAKWDKPWDTTSDEAFSMPFLFQHPKVWRGPGMERIWWLYVHTFFGFLLLKFLAIALWAHMPLSGFASRVLRHLLAALYPMLLSLPLTLYLVYYQAAVLNCRQCALWHCGAYSRTDQHLQLNIQAFKAAGGCDIMNISQLADFRRYVEVGTKRFAEHEHCGYEKNAILDALGISLDTSRREGTCQPWGDTERARDNVILKDLDEVCGYGSSKKLALQKYIVTPFDRDRLPWSMFARHLPIDNEGTCEKEDAFFTGPYVYYDPEAGPPSGQHSVPEGGICVCRSSSGVRDCFRRVEGTIDRCSLFTAVPVKYGGLLQFSGVPHLGGHGLLSFLGLVIPVFALFTVKAWDDVPLAGRDKFDQRMQSRMKLDILDFYMFFLASTKDGKKDTSLPLLKFVFPETPWHDFELYIWCIAWGTAFVWWSLTIFLRVLDSDPDKTPKMWKTVHQILNVAERSAAALESQSRVEDPYQTSVRKQSVLYEKELQKLLKKRMVVDILGEDVDPDSASVRDWRRCIIVFSSPKVKDLKPADFERESGTFTLHISGAWPWSTRPPADVWKAETWEEYVANAAPGIAESQLARGLEKITLKYDDVLLRTRPGSPYYWFDVRYLGWFYFCGCQPLSEYKKMKEEDHRISSADRSRGYSEVYYNKFKFDFFERNMEFIGSLRSLFVDLLFLAARLAKGMWVGGFSGHLSVLLVLKNCVFSVFGFVYLLTCGNTKHTCGSCGASPLELIAKCIERTKIGSAIKLSMLMPMRICIECISCGFRLSAEDRQAYLVQRLHFLLLRRLKVGTRSEENAPLTKELDHEIRLVAGQVSEYEELIEMLETKNIVKMRARIKAKDIVA